MRIKKRSFRKGRALYRAGLTQVRVYWKADKVQLKFVFLAKGFVM